MSRDAAIVLDIRKAAELIGEFVRGHDRATFDKDAKTQSAVLHQIMVLGEAANRLSESLRHELADVPWRLMIGMRNRLIHGYDDVDLDEVWATATKDVPALLRDLARLDVDEL
jgi:uncharacterized protein with HEPN domain